jgi:RimJ/RimL family protein N-acetyltransferase
VEEVWTFDDHPPEQIATAGIELRRYQGDEVQDLMRAINESIDHLRPWMPWAAEPHTQDQVEDFVQRVRAQWEAGDNFSYALRERETERIVGSFGLHPRLGPHAIEIGYWVRADRTRRGYATAAARELTAAGLALHGVERVEIRCDEANVASAAVPRRLGYELDRIEQDAIEAPGETGRSMIWVTDAARWSRQLDT